MVHLSLYHIPHVSSMDTRVQSVWITCGVRLIGPVCHKRSALGVITCIIFCSGCSCPPGHGTLHELAGPICLIVKSRHKFTAYLTGKEEVKMYILVGQLVCKTTYPIRINISQINVFCGSHGSSITSDNYLTLHRTVRHSLVARTPNHSHFFSFTGLYRSIFSWRGLDNLIHFLSQGHYRTGIVRPVDIKAPVQAPGRPDRI